MCHATPSSPDGPDYSWPGPDDIRHPDYVPKRGYPPIRPFPHNLMFSDANFFTYELIRYFTPGPDGGPDQRIRIPIQPLHCDFALRLAHV